MLQIYFENGSFAAWFTVLCMKFVYGVYPKPNWHGSFFGADSKKNNNDMLSYV